MNPYELADIHPHSRVYPSARILNYQKNVESIKLGSQTQLLGELLVYWKSGRIEIGKRSYISAGSRIWSQASVTIGNHVLISHNVDIHDTDGHPQDWMDRRQDSAAIYSGGFREPCMTQFAPVAIEDDAWIGFKATILKGVRIGRGAIVAAAAVVTKDVPPVTVVAGNPARPIKQLPTSESALAELSDEEWEEHLLEVEEAAGGVPGGLPIDASYQDLQIQLEEKDQEIQNLAMACQERLLQIQEQDAEIRKITKISKARQDLIERMRKVVWPFFRK